MGCSALRISDLPNAQKAFARVIQLHPEDGEAWNNLAAVYIKLDKKPEAFHALKYAVQLRGDNWKIWENYIKTAIDLREINECLHGLSQLLNLKENQKVDIPVLSTVIKYVLEDIAKGNSNFSSPMYQRLNEFLSEVSMKLSDDPDVWDLYSKYWLAIGSVENSIMYRQMQCRALQKAGWEHTQPLFIKVCQACEHYTKVHLLSTSASRLHTARLYLNSLVKKSDDSFAGTEWHDKLKEMLKEIVEKEALLIQK
jgi:tetratricopeptide (TPR) repeat protein